MYKIQNWKDMTSWAKFFVFFLPICTVVMLGIGVREYLSGDLNRDYFSDLFLFFLLAFSIFGMFGLVVKTEK
tara:strand:- start:2131 stop:2346 length:216 start_codon:yes stop_codon:yes gene_type:complete